MEEKAISSLVTQYVTHLRQERGLSEVTINDYTRYLKDFLTCIRGHDSLQNLNIVEIDDILKSKHSVKGYHRCTIQGYASVIRGFLTYVEVKGLCSKGLAKSIKMGRIYRHETLPSGPSWDEVQRLLKSTEGDNPKNIRDRAI
jgi:site-specific recombinase XerD